MGNLTEEKLVAAEVLPQAIARAGADPLPGPLAKAYGPSCVLVGDRTVRRPCSGDWPILKALDSPLYKLALDTAQNSEASTPVNFSVKPEDEWMICWQFTHSIKECRELLILGVESFLAKAAEQIGDVWSADEVSLVQAVVMAKLAESRRAALKFAADLEEKGEVRFFRDSGETRKTAPAG